MATVDQPKAARKGANRTAEFLSQLARFDPKTAAHVARELGAPAPVPSSAPKPSARLAPPPKSPRRKQRGTQSRQQRSRLRAQRVRDREERYLAKLTARIFDSTGNSRPQIRQIPLRVWVTCSQIMADRTGRAARIALRRLNNRAAAGLALTLIDGTRRAWSDTRTRREVTLVVALVMLGKRTRRRGVWNACVKGIPRGAIAALLRDPYDQRKKATPAITTIYGTHRPDGTHTNGSAGYIHALIDLGVLYRQQLPASQAEPCELWGKSGHAFNRYWLITDEPWTIDHDDVRRWCLDAIDAGNADADSLTAQLARERRAQIPPPTPPPPN